jgi:alcohol dehydrogenase class IV
MRLVKNNLARALKDGSDLEARAHMMSAAAMGATAFQKALGAIHALSHPVGALYDTHHGLTNAVFMPYVLAFNRPAIEGKDRPSRPPTSGAGADVRRRSSPGCWSCEPRSASRTRSPG